MTAMTKHDAINAAMGVAEDVAEGRLAVGDLEQQSVTELRALFGTVVGPDDPAWHVQADVAHQAIALGALTADELSEWAAVMRRRAGETLSDSGSAGTLPEPVSLASQAHSSETVDTEPVAVADVQPVPAPEPQPRLSVVPDPPPQPQRRAASTAYDALAGWSPGGSRRL